MACMDSYFFTSSLIWSLSLSFNECSPDSSKSMVSSRSTSPRKSGAVQGFFQSVKVRNPHNWKRLAMQATSANLCRAHHRATGMPVALDMTRTRWPCTQKNDDRKMVTDRHGMFPILPTFDSTAKTERNSTVTSLLWGNRDTVKKSSLFVHQTANLQLAVRPQLKSWVLDRKLKLTWTQCLEESIYFIKLISTVQGSTSHSPEGSVETQTLPLFHCSRVLWPAASFWDEALMAHRSKVFWGNLPCRSICNAKKCSKANAKFALEISWDQDFAETWSFDDVLRHSGFLLCRMSPRFRWPGP